MRWRRCALGYATALHTAGMYPERLAAALPLLDWVGLDIKAPLHRYDAITGVPGSGVKAWDALRRLLGSGVAYECRTTWHPGLYPVEELQALGQALRQLGLRHWVLQPCEDKRAPGSAQAARQALEQGVAQAWPGLAVATLRG